jgi:hypothetical protein
MFPNSCSCMCALTHLLPVHVDAVPLRRVACRQPALGVLVVEGPRRDDGEEGERGAGEAHVERQADVLCKVADKEGDDLGRQHRNVCQRGADVLQPHPAARWSASPRGAGPRSPAHVSCLRIHIAIVTGYARSGPRRHRAPARGAVPTWRGVVWRRVGGFRCRRGRR